MDNINLLFFILALLVTVIVIGLLANSLIKPQKSRKRLESDDHNQGKRAADTPLSDLIDLRKKHIIHLILISPDCLYAYWVLEEKFSEQIIIRMVPTNSDPVDIFVDFDADNWYIEATPFQGAVVTALLGKMTASGDFIQLAKSNSISVPSTSVSTTSSHTKWKPISEIWDQAGAISSQCVSSEAFSSEIFAERMKP